MLSLTIKVTAAAAFAQAVKIDAQAKKDDLWLNARNVAGSLVWPLPRASASSFVVTDIIPNQEDYRGRLEFSTPENMGAMVFKNSDHTGENRIYYTGDARVLHNVNPAWLVGEPSFYWDADLAQPDDATITLFESNDCSQIAANQTAETSSGSGALTLSIDVS